MPDTPEWFLVGSELWRRCRIIFSPTGAGYVLAACVFFGGIGVWGTLAANWYGKASSQELFIAAATFAFAFAFTALADALLDDAINATLRVIFLVLALLAAVPSICLLLDLLFAKVPVEMNTWLTVLVAGPPSLVWALVTAGDPKLKPRRWDTPAGGQPDGPLEDQA